MFTDKIATLSLVKVINFLRGARKGRISTITYYTKSDTVDGSIIYKVTSRQFLANINYKHRKNYKAPKKPKVTTTAVESPAVYIIE